MARARAREVVDLTTDEPARQRRRTGDYVYMVIHDKIPQDSGSDFEYSNSLPETQDTQIVGIFTSMALAVAAAEAYVEEEFGEVDEEECERGEWLKEGFFRTERAPAYWCKILMHSNTDILQCRVPDDLFFDAGDPTPTTQTIASPSSA